MIASNRGFGRVAVIAGIGTRQYYATLGYILDGKYMCKNLPWLGLSGACRVAGMLFGRLNQGYRLFVSKPLQVLRWRPQACTGTEWGDLTSEQAFARVVLAALLAATGLLLAIVCAYMCLCFWSASPGGTAAGAASATGVAAPSSTELR